MDKMNSSSENSIYRMLIVDDDNKWALKTKEYLEVRSGFNIVVDIVNNTTEATKKIEQIPYAAVIVDNCFSPGEETAENGDDWILSKLQLLKNSYVLMMTGYAISWKILEELRRNKIYVVIKSTGEEIIELDKVVEKAIATANSFPQREAAGIDLPIDKEITMLARSLFVEWLCTRTDQDQKDIWIGGESFSIRDLIYEVENKTDVGQLLVKQFIKQIRFMLDLENTQDTTIKDKLQE